MQLARRGFQVGPHCDVSHRDHAVDAGVGQPGAVRSTEVELGPTRTDSSPVVPNGLIAHLRGWVDAADARRISAFGQLPDETAWAIADFEDVLARLDPEDVEHAVVLVCPQHEPARQSAEPAARMRERIVGRRVEDRGS